MKMSKKLSNQEKIDFETWFNQHKSNPNDDFRRRVVSQMDKQTISSLVKLTGIHHSTFYRWKQKPDSASNPEKVSPPKHFSFDLKAFELHQHPNEVGTKNLLAAYKVEAKSLEIYDLEGLKFFLSQMPIFVGK